MIQVLQRAFDLLELLAKAPRSLAELNAATGLHKPTLHNILSSLDHVGAVRQIEGRRYTIGAKLAELGGRDTWAGLTLLSHEVLQTVVDELNESCNVSVLHNGERRTLVHMSGGHDLIANARFGQTGPLYRAATGRVLVAYLEPSQRKTLIELHGWPGKDWNGIRNFKQLEAVAGDIRAEGMAVVGVSESQIGMIAAPVRGSGDEVVAALGVAVPTVRFKGTYKKRVADCVKNAATELEEQIKIASGWNVLLKALPDPASAKTKTRKQS